MNYMPMEEFHKVYNNSTEIESLRTSLNAIYIDVIKNAEIPKLNFHLEQKLVKMYVVVIICYLI
jgi:hypothetical protein